MPASSTAFAICRQTAARPQINQLIHTSKN